MADDVGDCGYGGGGGGGGVQCKREFCLVNEC